MDTQRKTIAAGVVACLVIVALQWYFLTRVAHRDAATLRQKANECAAEAKRLTDASADCGMARVNLLAVTEERDELIRANKKCKLEREALEAARTTLRAQIDTLNASCENEVAQAIVALEAYTTLGFDAIVSLTQISLTVQFNRAKPTNVENRLMQKVPQALLHSLCASIRFFLLPSGISTVPTRQYSVIIAALMTAFASEYMSFDEMRFTTDYTDDILAVDALLNDTYPYQSTLTSLHLLSYA